MTKKIRDFSSLNGLYIHVPFCAKICPYCDFAVMAVSSPKTRADLESKWLNCLFNELHSRKSEFSKFDTIYIGGGTPSELSYSNWEKLLCFLKEEIIKDNNILEFAIEGNPESISIEKLELWQKYNINRLSIGVQSFNDEQLLCYGRNHDSQTAINALRMAENYKFDLSLDVIFAGPNQSVESFKKDLLKAFEFDLSHISFYGLSVENNTLFGQQYAKNKLEIPDNYEDFYLSGVELVAKHGFNRYEISNFALEGKESIHNRIYWNYGSWLGVGPGAHSFDNKLMIRRANHRKFNSWIKDVNAENVGEWIENLSVQEQLQEELWLALRMPEGIDLNYFIKKYGVSSFDLSKIEEFISKDWLVSDLNNYLTLKSLGWLFIDQIAIELLV